jgi:hypothetical protein
MRPYRLTTKIIDYSSQMSSNDEKITSPLAFAWIWHID